MNAELKRNLSLVRQLVVRELAVKYRGSMLGYLWSMLNPLLFMAILSLVFSHFMKGIPNYNLFILAGILSWNLGSQSISMATHSLVNNSGLLRKVKVSYWVFQITPIFSCLINFSLAMVPYSFIYLLSDRSVPLSFILLPFVLALYCIFLTGVGLCLGTLNIFFRDIGHMLEPVLQLCFYATPIIYDRQSSSIPIWASNLLGLNPFTHYIEALKCCLYGGEALSVPRFMMLFLISATSLLIGSAIHMRAKPRIAFNL